MSTNIYLIFYPERTIFQRIRPRRPDGFHDPGKWDHDLKSNPSSALGPDPLHLGSDIPKVFHRSVIHRELRD